MFVIIRAFTAQREQIPHVSLHGEIAASNTFTFFCELQFYTSVSMFKQCSCCYFRQALQTGYLGESQRQWFSLSLHNLYSVCTL